MWIMVIIWYWNKLQKFHESAPQKWLQIIYNYFFLYECKIASTGTKRNNVNLTQSLL